jgi:hypothetical protein
MVPGRPPYRPEAAKQRSGRPEKCRELAVYRELLSALEGPEPIDKAVKSGRSAWSKGKSDILVSFSNVQWLSRSVYLAEISSFASVVSHY